VLLKTVELTKRFGGLAAVEKVDIQVEKGEMVGIIGPNGAGKTTIFNLITGFLRPNKGTVEFEGKDIVGLKPHMIARLGIGRTFQLNPLFADFTVLQNVVASFYLYPKSSLLSAFFNTPTYRRNEVYISEKALEILELLGTQWRERRTRQKSSPRSSKNARYCKGSCCQPQIAIVG
jgi:branched-chain amino acid transport system ATP-binding protein